MTVKSNEGKVISDDYIKYHQITEKIVEAEDNIVNEHYDVIKEEANLLKSQGDMIVKIKEMKGVNTNEYFDSLLAILDQKVANYEKIERNIKKYK